MKELESNPLTEEEMQEISKKIMLFRIDKVMYVLYSEHMEMYIEYIHQRFDGKNASVTEMLEYCQLHNIKVIPFPLKKKTMWGYSKLFSKIKAFGCAIDDMELCERITRCISEASAAAKKREAH
jgi:hypothetical protein